MAIVKKRVDRLFGRQANAPNFETPTAGTIKLKKMLRLGF